MHAYLRTPVACYQGRFSGVGNFFPSTTSAVPMSPVNIPSATAHLAKGWALHARSSWRPVLARLAHVESLGPFHQALCGLIGCNGFGASSILLL